MDDEILISLTKKWLSQYQLGEIKSLSVLAGDASARKYYRLQTSKKNLIIMDCRAAQNVTSTFLTITQVLNNLDLPVPTIYAADQTHHLVLLEDFGDITMLQGLTQSSDQVSQHALYQQAVDLLVKMQTLTPTASMQVAFYDDKKLLRECALFPEWFLGQYLQLSISANDRKIIQDTFQLLIANATSQPPCLVHRDYHSRNLMVKPNGSLAMIDYQDAVWGAIAYDWASLLKDCYITLQRDQQLMWLKQGYQALSESLTLPSWDMFLRCFDWIGLQRHLKVLGIFSRLAIRDGKSGYLDDIPRILDYVTFTCQSYTELTKLLPTIERAKAAFVSKHLAVEPA